MKRTVNILRVAACVSVSLYTVFACYLCGQTANYSCMKILVDENGAYYAATGGITREAVPFIVVAAVLVLLGVASVVLMFRRGRLATCLSGAAAVVSAILGMCTDTRLAEIMFARYTLGLTNLRWDSGVLLSFKPMTADLCICATVVYVILFLIAYRKQRQCNDDCLENQSYKTK